MPKTITILLFSALAALSCFGEDDGLKLALSVKPKIFISTWVQQELGDSLNSEEIKNDAELLLRQSNIPIVNGSGDGVLLVSVRAAELSVSRSSLYAVVPEVTYMERVVPGVVLSSCLIDNGKAEKMFDCAMGHTIFTEIWRKDSVLQVGENRLPELRGAVKNLVQKFVLEYLHASDPKN